MTSQPMADDHALWQLTENGLDVRRRLQYRDRHAGPDAQLLWQWCARITDCHYRPPGQKHAPIGRPRAGRIARRRAEPGWRRIDSLSKRSEQCTPGDTLFRLQARTK